MKVPAQKTVEGRAYALDFYDGFEQAELDPEKWIPFYLPQ